jgi:hypothetical protein
MGLEYGKNCAAWRGRGWSPAGTITDQLGEAASGSMVQMSWWMSNSSQPPKRTNFPVPGSNVQPEY